MYLVQTSGLDLSLVSFITTCDEIFRSRSTLITTPVDFLEVWQYGSHFDPLTFPSIGGVELLSQCVADSHLKEELSIRDLEINPTLEELLSSPIPPHATNQHTDK